MSDFDLTAWLRGLPIGTVLLDVDGDAWQVRRLSEYDKSDRQFVAIQMVGSEGPWDRDDDDDMAELAVSAPFTVLYMPPVGGAS